MGVRKLRIDLHRPLVSLESQGRVLFGAPGVSLLGGRAPKLLAGQSEVVARGGALWKDPSEGAEDLHRQLELSVAGFQDAGLGELVFDVRLDREDEPPVVLGMLYLGLVGQKPEHPGDDGFPRDRLRARMPIRVGNLAGQNDRKQNCGVQKDAGLLLRISDQPGLEVPDREVPEVSERVSHRANVGRADGGVKPSDGCDGAY